MFDNELYTVMRIGKIKGNKESIALLNSSSGETWMSLFEAVSIVESEKQLDKLERINNKYRIVMKNDRSIKD